MLEIKGWENVGSPGQVEKEIWKSEDARWSWMAHISVWYLTETKNQMQKYEQVSSNWTKYQAATFCIFVHGVFSDSKGGRRMLGAGLLVCSETYCHRAVTVWSGSSCELFLLENLIRPMEEKTEPELEPGLSTFSSAAWQEQGRSACGLVWPARGQDPGASQPLPVHSWLSFPCATAVSWMSRRTPPRQRRPTLPIQVLLAPGQGTYAISDTGPLGYSALASPLRAVTPGTVRPDPTTQGDQEAWTPKGRFSRQTSRSSLRGSQSSPHFGDWGPAPLLPVAGLPGGPGGLRAPRPPWSLAKPRTRLSADPARPQRKRETGQAWVQVLLVPHGSGPPPWLGLARKSSSQLGPGQTVSARWQYCPRTVPAPRLVLPPFESEKTPWTDKGLRK